MAFCADRATHEQCRALLSHLAELRAQNLESVNRPSPGDPPSDASRALPVPVQDPPQNRPDPLATQNAARIAEIRARGEEYRDLFNRGLNRSPTARLNNLNPDDIENRIAEARILAEIGRDERIQRGREQRTRARLASEERERNQNHDLFPHLEEVSNPRPFRGPRRRYFIPGDIPIHDQFLRPQTRARRTRFSRGAVRVIYLDGDYRVRRQIAPDVIMMKPWHRLAWREFCLDHCGLKWKFLQIPRRMWRVLQSYYLKDPECPL